LSNHLKKSIHFKNIFRDSLRKKEIKRIFLSAGLDTLGFFVFLLIFVLFAVFILNESRSLEKATPYAKSVLDEVNKARQNQSHDLFNIKEGGKVVKDVVRSFFLKFIAGTTLTLILCLIVFSSFEFAGFMCLDGEKVRLGGLSKFFLVNLVWLLSFICLSLLSFFVLNKTLAVIFVFLIGTIIIYFSTFSKISFIKTHELKKAMLDGFGIATKMKSLLFFIFMLFGIFGVFIFGGFLKMVFPDWLILAILLFFIFIAWSRKFLLLLYSGIKNEI